MICSVSPYAARLTYFTTRMWMAVRWIECEMPGQFCYSLELTNDKSAGWSASTKCRRSLKSLHMHSRWLRDSPFKWTGKSSKHIFGLVGVWKSLLIVCVNPKSIIHVLIDMITNWRRAHDRLTTLLLIARQSLRVISLLLSLVGSPDKNFCKRFTKNKFFQKTLYNKSMQKLFPSLVKSHPEV